VECLGNFLQEIKSKFLVHSCHLRISDIWFHYKLNGLHITPSSSAGEVTSCELYDQTVFHSRAAYFILLRVPLVFCLVRAIPLYVMVELVENGHWCLVPASTWRYICCVPDHFPCVHAVVDMMIVLATIASWATLQALSYHVLVIECMQSWCVSEM
jgi:hypothetical protein